MKLRTPLLSGLFAGSLLFGAVALAQNAPAPAASTAMNGSGSTSATYQTPQGQLVVNSAPAPAPTFAPAPDFSQLSGGSKSITAEQAASYPPLANDFLNADTNKDGKISKSEYARWVKQLN
ncbi:MAG: EF-hand domain-containing protein [Rhodanobacter sp.]